MSRYRVDNVPLVFRGPFLVYGYVLGSLWFAFLLLLLMLLILAVVVAVLWAPFIDDMGGLWDYLQQALLGREFYETPKPRWESLHPIMALVELYWITGDDEYRKAFEQIWWSILEVSERMRLPWPAASTMPMRE